MIQLHSEEAKLEETTVSTEQIAYVKLGLRQKIGRWVEAAYHEITHSLIDLILDIESLMEVISIWA